MKYIVTSALPYVNNIPHLGNMVCIISADIYARFLKITNKDVVSVIGTDEHGTTTETVALQKNLSPKQVVDHYYKIHKEIYEWFNCEFDCLGRTTFKENHEITQDIFLDLQKNDYITEKEDKQYFDEQTQKFLSDRFIEGTCPHCKFEDARGDQCDNCGKLLKPTELINPRSKLSGKKPILKKTKHLYIKLDELQPLVEEHFQKVKDSWSDNAVQTTKSWLKEGLKPRAITRDLNWGIKVPKEGYENKVFYVWFDAPIGYISITKHFKKDWEEYWLKEENKLIQFMGKDNIPFHSIMFPSFLIGTKKPYKLIDTLSANEYLNYEDKKFSKSRQIGVFADSAKDTGIPADIWRYYIIINRPEKTDTKFTWNDLQEKNNNELAANLGNLLNRTLAFTKKFLSSEIGTPNKEFDYDQDIKEILEDYENIHLKDALKKIMHLSKKANGYFQEKEPWKLKEGKDVVLANLINAIKDISILIYPVMPSIASQIQKQINYDNLNIDGLKEKLQNHKINNPKSLFDKIEDDKIEILKEQFGGKKNNLTIKVGKITQVKKHPKADKLYIEKVDLGDETRQIISGLVPYYEEKYLLGKKVLIVTNLKSAKLRGELSEGMLLAAGEKDVSILTSKEEIGTYISQYSKEIDIKEFQKTQLEYKKGLFINQKKVNFKINSDKNIDGKVR